MVSSPITSNERAVVVITSVNAPTAAVRSNAAAAIKCCAKIIVVGDVSSPPQYKCEGVSFFDVEAQHASGFAYARSAPLRHYARKNIGYLLAIKSGASIIIDTDDDNISLPGFWDFRAPTLRVACVDEGDWINVYRYFSGTAIWPRGLPLDAIQKEVPPYEQLPVRTAYCPIQQGLADNNPDVDAIYRMCFPLPYVFNKGRSVALGGQALCPFNSQNTRWYAPAFPLLYLPAHCSFRMTDIWRSFIAQRVAAANDWYILFHDATVTQDRNSHDLMRDFEDEVPGYLNNRRIGAALAQLTLEGGEAAIWDDMRKCYGRLVDMCLLAPDELILFEAWERDVNRLTRDNVPAVG